MKLKLNPVLLFLSMILMFSCTQDEVVIEEQIEPDVAENNDIVLPALPNFSCPNKLELDSAMIHEKLLGSWQYIGSEGIGWSSAGGYEYYMSEANRLIEVHFIDNQTLEMRKDGELSVYTWTIEVRRETSPEIPEEYMINFLELSNVGYLGGFISFCEDNRVNFDAMPYDGSNKQFYKIE